MNQERTRHPRLRRAAIVLAALLVLFALLYQRCGLGGCPNVDQLTAYQPGGESVLLDRQGEKFAELKPVEHAVVELESLPEFVPAAFVAVEDKRFYEHGGVDYRRVLGSVVANVKSLGFAQGFSTITMQIGGNVWRDRVKRRKKTIGRKLVEIRLARAIERQYSKQEILELYINNIYFGDGAYGIEAAARNYFRRPAGELTLAQAALLAALPKSPTIYGPRRSPERAKERRDLVLALMEQQGRITAAQATRARRQKISVRRDPPARREPAATAPYFVEAVRRMLEDRLGEDMYTAPLRVHTTLDRRAQRAAEQELTRQLRAVESGRYGRFEGRRYSASDEPGDETEYLQGAVVLMEARTGSVIAQVGGRDFKQSRYDRATRAKRQAGSAFKPFVYAAALAEGYAPSQHVIDTPLKMELAGGEVWEPRNYTGDFRGEMTLRDALVGSRNVPTIRLAADVGVSDVARLARSSGIAGTIPNEPSMALGTGTVTPLELTRAYTTFATLGRSAQPRWVERVEDANGRVLWDVKVRRTKVLEPDVAYLITDMLRDAVRRGTGTAVRNTGFRGAVAGKTGTTNDGMDAWFVGYTPELVGTVWLGFDQPAPIVDEASGGRLAAPVFGRIMQRVHANRPEKTWRRPEGIVERRVDPATGLLLPEGCRPASGTARTELFLERELPASICPRGKPDREPSALDRTLAWLRARWHRAGEWLASHFGREEERRQPRARERYLGVPRLPQAVEVGRPVAEPDLLGVPLDSVPVEAPRLPDPETMFVEPPPIAEDTIGADTLTANR